MAADPSSGNLAARAGELLAREAELLDRRRWHDWLGLYAEDGVLWAPAWLDDQSWTSDPERQVSLIYADRRNLEARIFRVEGGDSYASMPLPLTVHLVTGITASLASDGLVRAAAAWLVHGFLRSAGAIIRAGRYEYRLRDRGGALEIVEKKVYVHDDRVVGAIDFYNI